MVVSLENTESAIGPTVKIKEGLTVLVGTIEVYFDDATTKDIIKMRKILKAIEEINNMEVGKH